MSISQTLLPEFDHEMANTRETLTRVPEERFEWGPHPKSSSLGKLVTHIANLPSWAGLIIARDELDIAPVGQGPFRVPQATSLQEVLDEFDRHVAATRSAISEANDDHLMQPWSLLYGGKTVTTMPRAALLRNFMSHIVHHRAQLGVYLRLLDVPVPSLYGPSADEGAL